MMRYDLHRIMYGVRGDFDLCTEGHVASFRDITVRASNEMIEAHKAQLDYLSERLMPNNYNHTADSGTVV
ncbi:MAG: hypothetical protein AABW80_02025 [Nanoarchaeota archaeon]